jgi:hypothetical protein
MFSLRAEGFSCRLDVLYEGLGISKLQFLVIKTLNPDPALTSIFVFSIFFLVNNQFKIISVIIIRDLSGRICQLQST